MRSKRSEQRVEPGRVVVVQQQPYANAAIRCGAQGLEQQGTRHVVVPDVILNIKRTLGALCQQRPRSKRIARIRQRVDTRDSWMRVDHRRNCPPKPGIAGVEEGCRSASVFKGWQSAASPNEASAQAKSQHVSCDDCAHV